MRQQKCAHKKEQFSRAILNLFVERETIRTSGKEVHELFDTVYVDVVQGKKSDETISLETTFSELCNNPEKTLKAEPAEESVMQQLVQAKQSLPKQKNPEVQERVNRAVDNIIRNFGAVRMSTGMTPEEAVKLAAKTVGGKDSDVFVPPASGRISRQISAAVWSDRLLHDKFKKSAIEAKDAHVNVNGNHISEMDNGKNHIDRYEEANGKESPLPAAASVTSSAGKLSDATWNRTSDLVSHESTDVRNNPDTHTGMLFNGRVPDQEAMESSHGRYTGDISEKTPASKPAQQKNSGKVNESTSHPAIEDEEAVKLERMNANYEHDKAILAKTDPAFARNQFRDVGHVERDDDYLEKQELDKIRRMALDSEIRNSRGIIQ